MIEKMTSKQPISQAEALRRLRLFNEKAEKLANSRFVERVKQGRQLTIRMGADQPLTVERQGPDGEATDAMLLTLRFFFNKGDGISLAGILELYEALPILEDERVKAREAFGRYDTFLDSRIGVIFKGNDLTNRDILDTILWGDLAHAKSDKRAVFEQWRQAAPFDQIALDRFEDVVVAVIKLVLACQLFNEELLKRPFQP
jgi:hypothetical protein